jgi:hypothetical protein
MKSLISILAGVVTAGLFFAYLGTGTSCLVSHPLGVQGREVYEECVMRVLPGYSITWDGGAWPYPFLPAYLLPAVTGLLVGLILWAVWARRQGPHSSPS